MKGHRCQPELADESVGSCFFASSVAGHDKKTAPVRFGAVSLDGLDVADVHGGDILGISLRDPTQIPEGIILPPAPCDAVAGRAERTPAGAQLDCPSCVRLSRGRKYQRR